MTAIGVELDAPRFRIRQLIFHASSAEGVNFAFASLRDGRCAIVQGDQLVDAWDDHPRGVHAAVDRFMELTEKPPKRVALASAPKRTRA
jgi:hypothetical protein